MSGNTVKTKFTRWVIAVLFLWMLSELGVSRLAPHIPWLVGLTWVWAAMLPLLENSGMMNNQVFIRLMLAYVTSGVMLALLIPSFLAVGDDWQASLIFYAGAISVSGFSFLVYRYGQGARDAGPAVGALLLAGLAMYLAQRYTLIDSLLVALLVAFLLTVSATFCLFLLVTALTHYYGKGDVAQADDAPPVWEEAGFVLMSASRSGGQADDDDQATAGVYSSGQIVRGIGSLMTLVLVLAVLLSLLNILGH